LSSGNLANLDHIADGLEIIIGDVRDTGPVKKSVTGVDVIFHEAAIPSVPKSIDDPIENVSVNTVGTVNVLSEAVKANVKRFVYAASASAYGEISSGKANEALLPKPQSPYAAAKLASEYCLSAFSQCYGIETVGIRYFNVFGERQDPHSEYAGVIAKFITQMLAGKTPTIFGDGKTSRDFTYIANVVDGNMLAASLPAEDVSGEVMNVACGRSVDLNDLVSSINRILGSQLTPQYAPERVGDIRHSCADISKAVTKLGYKPQVGFEEGMARTINWLRQSIMESTALLSQECN
ncbi:MAG: NAD-dependent epimerase/dehydratase family protein, partial [Pirellulales bacterium]|nr:NAD-dependent epimerase/dehydratase family protein [Pirellulales bacterium]